MTTAAILAAVVLSQAAPNAEKRARKKARVEAFHLDPHADDFEQVMSRASEIAGLRVCTDKASPEWSGCIDQMVVDELLIWIGINDKGVFQQDLEKLGPPDLRGVSIFRSESFKSCEALVTQDAVGTGCALAMAKTRVASPMFATTVAKLRTEYKQWRAASGFQAARWGMTVKEVRRAFPKAKKVKGDRLVVSQQVASMDAECRFSFVDGRLWAVDVVFTARHVNADRFVEDFEHIRGLLVKKYGDAEAIEDETDTTSEGMAALVGKGTAVRAGHLTMQSRWTPDTETALDLVLAGREARVVHSLRYESIALRRRAAHLAELAAMDEL